ncbi:hypothetical protein OK015_28675 (plasmid) [Mycobacterium sp. Aquia_216]|uniref:hypothetical protein n=1 Tax=Mycobacterium sp. Aquia_216 TaxID=2991729 RepID=UPI00227A571B|nr:hypothetical protein [Mycobacterium sp. Aquia_216]WAJ48025.1 hypothetical protein OK015_28675 [Mycobacterium sp. Aquia_216]
MFDQPVWNYRAIIDAADRAAQADLRDQLFRAPFRIRSYNGGTVTSSVYRAADQLELYNPEHVIDLFQAFHDAGAYEWDANTQTMREVEDPDRYIHRIKRPANIPRTPGARE